MTLLSQGRRDGEKDGTEEGAPWQPLAVVPAMGMGAEEKEAGVDPAGELKEAKAWLRRLEDEVNEAKAERGPLKRGSEEFKRAEARVDALLAERQQAGSLVATLLTLLAQARAAVELEREKQVTASKETEKLSKEVELERQRTLTEEAKGKAEEAVTNRRIAELKSQSRRGKPPLAISTGQVTSFRVTRELDDLPLDTVCGAESTGEWWAAPSEAAEEARQAAWNDAITKGLLGSSPHRKFFDGHKKFSLVDTTVGGTKMAPDAVLLSATYESGDYFVPDIYAIIDLKAANKNENSDGIQRLWLYSRAVFSGDPLRTKFLAATCDLVHINFFMFHRDESVIDAFPALPCNKYESQGSVALRHLLTVDPDKIGFPHIKLRPLHLALQGQTYGPIGQQLGLSGACGTVYAVGDEMVLKVFDQAKAVHADHNKEFANMQRRDLESLYITDVRNNAGHDESIKRHLPEVVQKVGETGLLLRPRGSHEGATLQSFVDLLKVFKWLHGTVNKVHRDVRPSNLVVVGDPPRLVLIDWGCLWRVGVEAEYSGTLSTTADEVLDLVAGKITRTTPTVPTPMRFYTRSSAAASASVEVVTKYTPSPVHDLVAFVRSFFMVLHPEEITITKETSRSEQARVILSAWGKFKNGNYETALKAALASDHGAIARAFEAEWGASRVSVSWGR
jgi:hypothetical protein